MGCVGPCAHERYAVARVHVGAKWTLKHVSSVTPTHMQPHILPTFQEKLMDIPDFVTKY